MGDAENALHSSKKRVAGRQLSKDNPEGDDDASELETGTFQRASDEVLATRKFVKVRRTQATPAHSSNPFATIRLSPHSDSVAKAACSPVQSNAVGDKEDTTNEKIGKSGTSEETESGNVVHERNGTEGTSKKLESITDVSTDKVVDKDADGKTERGMSKEEKEEKEDSEEHIDEAEKVVGEKNEESIGKGEKAVREKAEEALGKAEKIIGEETEKATSENGNEDAAKPVASFSSFQQLSSSQNAFTGLAGTGFRTSSFSFGTAVKEGSTFDPGSRSIFAFKSETQSSPLFGSGSTNNGNFSLQPPAQGIGLPPMPVVPVETGEENETVVFTADAILYEYLDGGWKERGKGELKVNTHTSGAQKARLVMRARGNYRLILNANLYPDMILTNMEKKGITFACLNNTGEKLKTHELTTFALKFKDSSFVEEFRSVVTEHKGTKENVLKTPENSPKASED